MLTTFNQVLRRHHVVTTWLLILLVGVVDQSILKGGFVSDDVEQILKNSYIKNPHLWRNIFSGGVWSFAGGVSQAGFYRPLQMFTYWLICRVAGFNPAAYHFVQLSLYAVTVWVVYRIARRLLASEVAAFVGAALWALHPLHVEAVAWVAALPDVGCALFCLLGFWCFLRAEDHTPGNFSSHLFAALVFLPALFFKELAFSFPLLILAYWLCFGKREAWSRCAVNWIPYATAAGLALAVRVLAMGGRASVPGAFRAESMRVAVGLLGQHARLFFWPANLSIFRSFDLGSSLRSPWPWIAMVVVVGAIVFRKREPQLGFFILWWLITLLPCLDFRYLSIPFVADRFSYLPSAGLCLAVADLLCDWLPRRLQLPWTPVVALTVIVTGLGFASIETWRTIPHWHDNETLAGYSLRVAGSTAELHVAHAVNLQLEHADWRGAQREFEAAIELNQRSIRPSGAVLYDSEVGLAQIAISQGRDPEALELLHRAISLKPDYSFAYNVLGSFYFPRGDYARAGEAFQNAVRTSPLDTSARFFLGTCWLKLGKPTEAAAEFHAALEIDPSFTQAYTAEARALNFPRDAASDKPARSQLSK